MRCSLLRAGPGQRQRLVEIRDNLIAHIGEAEREGWLGEVEWPKVGPAGAEDTLAQLDRQSHGSIAVDLGLPALRHTR